MSRKSTADASSEKDRSIFVDLEGGYDTVAKEESLYCMRKSGESEKREDCADQ